ncbi:hypothetical protein A6J63_015905 [Yersinia enterocolitica]|nr:hypothetical protein A6J63_015905 [Yersinia enterocolitica]
MALTLLSANNASTVLSAGISASATTLTVNTGTGGLFPSPVSGTSFFKLTLIDAATGTLTEIVHVTARTGDTMTIVRGQEGTVSRLWSANDIAANMMTAGTLDLFAQSGTLGGAALLNVGTTAGTVAAGNDGRITGALQKSANLSDLANVQTALANLTLTDMGIGLPSMTVIANFDWQNFVFTSGANYLTAYNTWINPPAGITYNAGDNISVRVEYVYGNRIGLRLTPDTGAAANFKVYELLCVGAAGSRVFTFNQDWNSAIPVPITGGGTGGKTAAEAFTNLGLGDAAKLGAANNTQMAAGISTTLLPTVAAVMSLFAKRSFAVNDYIRIPDVPGGLIIQWMTGASTVTGDQDQTITFPTPFPTACLRIFVSTFGGSVNLSDGWFQERIGITTTTCIVNSQFTGSNLSGGITPRVLAIGY